MIFFVRSIPKSVVSALKLVGPPDEVMWLEDRFAHGAPDEEWLPVAGDEGWLVITRDKKIRTRPAERAVLMEHHVGCFIIGSNATLDRWDLHKLFAANLDEMIATFVATPRPFIYVLSREGRMRRAG